MALFSASSHGRMPPAIFPLVALVGPTAVGKTALSLRLAEELHAEIISADSVQVYRDLDIGSAKPSHQERRQVPHHLIDVADPDEPFDAADFVHKARGIIRVITLKGKLPLLVGGTGLYLKSLLEGLASCPGYDPVLRKMFQTIHVRHGKRVLHDLLTKLDPETAAKIHQNDAFRITRALEVYYLTGESISTWWKRHKSTAGAGLPCIKIGLIRPRPELYERIDLRVDDMLKAGLLDEVRSLMNRGYSPRLKSLQSLGYRHMIQFLGGKTSFREAVRLLKRDTRRYAKRQITWFRADPEIRWFHPEALMGLHKLWPGIVRGWI